jgi:hypothetical protein
MIALPRAGNGHAQADPVPPCQRARQCPRAKPVRPGDGRADPSGQPYAIGSEGTGNLPPARHWSDYRVSIDRADLPQGVEIIER